MICKKCEQNIVLQKIIELKIYLCYSCRLSTVPKWIDVECGTEYVSSRQYWKYLIAYCKKYY